MQNHTRFLSNFPRYKAHIFATEVQQAFAASVMHTDGDDGCWYWTGTLTAQGYGVFKAPTGLTPTGKRRRAKTFPAHRYSYQMGP